MEYKTRQWHEKCFACCVCKTPIGTKSFIPREQEIYCAGCYEEKYATRCIKCNQVIVFVSHKTFIFGIKNQTVPPSIVYYHIDFLSIRPRPQIITSGGVTYKNEPWHRECFTCTNCSTSLAGQRFTSRDEKPYCAECFGELFAKRCTACIKPITGAYTSEATKCLNAKWINIEKKNNNWFDLCIFFVYFIAGIGGTRFISFEDRHWHNDCFTCASCKTSLVGRGFITDETDIICPECAKQKLM